MSANAGYARERVRLTAEHVKRGLGMVASGKVPGRGLEFADDKCQGLVLRITPTAANYYLRLRKTTLKLGDARSVSVDVARDLADTSRIEAKSSVAGIRRALAIRETVQGDGIDDETKWEIALLAPEEPKQLPEEHRLQFGPWLWRDLVKKFLAFKERKLRADYHQKYAAYLKDPAFDAIADRPVASLKLGDLESVRDAIERTKGKSAVRRGVQQAKEALTWAWKNHAGISGLEDVQYDWWQRLNFDFSPGKRAHLPTIEELARTLVLAERHRTFGDTEHATAPGTLAALWAAMLTGQRTGQLVRLGRRDLHPDPDRPGWRIAVWSGQMMKGGKSGGREHALPLPPAVVESFESWWKEADGEGPASKHCFPSIRGDGHVGNGALNQLLYRLAGENPTPRKPGAKGFSHRRRAPRPEKREDLLSKHEIRRFIPHDIRRTLSTFLDENRLGGAGSAILAHKRSTRGDDRETLAEVTSRHYSQSQRLPLKAEGMELWVQAFMDAYRRERSIFESAGGELLAA